MVQVNALESTFRFYIWILFTSNPSLYVVQVAKVVVLRLISLDKSVYFASVDGLQTPANLACKALKLYLQRHAPCNLVGHVDALRLFLVVALTLANESWLE